MALLHPSIFRGSGACSYNYCRKYVATPHDGVYDCGISVPWWKDPGKVTRYAIILTKWLLSAMVKGFPITKDVTGWAMKCALRKEILLAVVELPEGGGPGRGYVARARTGLIPFFLEFGCG